MKDYIYVGTYTNKGSKGIYGFLYDGDRDVCSDAELLADMVSPTYLTLNHQKTVLYAVSEPTDGSNGAVTSYKIDSGNKHLSKLNSRLAPGQGLCHLTVDKNDRYLIAVCYRDATIQVYQLLGNGSIGEMVCLREHAGHGTNLVRQEKAHAHSAWFTPDEKYVCVCDLGLDLLAVYEIDWNTGILYEDKEMALSLPGGCGPRHLVFHPDGRYAYVAAELTSQIIVLSYGDKQTNDKKGSGIKDGNKKGFSIIRQRAAIPGILY